MPIPGYNPIKFDIPYERNYPKREERWDDTFGGQQVAPDSGSANPLLPGAWFHEDVGDLKGGEETPVLSTGSRVLLVNLRHEHMNGLYGTVVRAAADFKWRVRVDGFVRDKIFHANNLEPLPGGHVEPLDHCEILPQLCSEPPLYYIVGSWDTWERPHAMRWETDRRSYVYETTGQQSFQVLISGNHRLCVHPNKPHAAQDADVCGPDDQGQGLFWTIVSPSTSKVEVRVQLDLRNAVRYVHWDCVGDAPPETQAPTLRREPGGLAVQREVCEVVKPTDGAFPACLASNNKPMRKILHAARPDWSHKDLEVVQVKLARVQVENVVELQLALRSVGCDHLNERLRAAGEKAFTARTLSSLERAIEEADRLAGASMSDWGRLEPTWHSVMY